MTLRLRFAAVCNYISETFESLKEALAGKYATSIGASWLSAIGHKFRCNQLIQETLRKAEILAAPPTKSLDCCCNGFHPAHDLDTKNILRKIRIIDRTITWARREISDLEGLASSGTFEPALTETAISAANAKALVDDLSAVMGEVIASFIQDTTPPPPPVEAVFPPELM